MGLLHRKHLVIYLAVFAACLWLNPFEAVLADTPTPIVISVEEKITIGDGNNSSGGNIEESIGVTEEVITSGQMLKESIGVADKAFISGQLIQETIAITDKVESEIAAVPATATMVPTATKKPTATMKPVPPKKTPKTNTRAPIIFSPGSKFGPSVTPTPQATNKYGRAPVVSSKAAKPATSPSGPTKQKTTVGSKAPTRRTFGNFFGLRSSSSKDDDKKPTTSRSSTSRSRFSLVGRATGEDETQSDGQGDTAKESTGGSCSSASAREGVSVLAMVMLPLVIVNRKRLGL